MTFMIAKNRVYSLPRYLIDGTSLLMFGVGPQCGKNRVMSVSELSPNRQPMLALVENISWLSWHLVLEVMKVVGFKRSAPYATAGNFNPNGDNIM